MFEQFRHIPLIIGAVIALLLQIVLAPFITIGYAMPNFVVAFAVAYAIVSPNRTSPLVTAFVLGLLYNLFCGGVVGGMSLSLTVVCFAVSRLSGMIDSDNILTAVICIAVAVFAVELIYGIISLACGVQGGILEAFVYRALPCALYDVVIGVVAYLLVNRFMAEESVQTGVNNVRLR